MQFEINVKSIFPLTNNEMKSQKGKMVHFQPAGVKCMYVRRGKKSFVLLQQTNK